MLGATQLPQSLTALLNIAVVYPNVTPQGPEKLAAVYELLRVGANLCMDHGTLCTRALHKLNDVAIKDVNRQLLLNAELPQTICSLLKAYTLFLPYEKESACLELTVDDLKVIRTAVGVLLNATIGFGAHPQRHS